ncbi:MAG: hypothetical protein MSL80_06085 [Helicobacter sp.]|uniref:hypothetical protein n=1 Tax=Helicobacter sp. TaxID=218 RepID=UPI00375300A4|nr:hypothetical protein [Helicobacter sp.]
MENIGNDKESLKLQSNNQKHINPTMLKSNNETKPTESIKRDSMQETSINTESNKPESKKPNDTKNKDNIKPDSHGNEIVYEVRHRLGIQDTIQYIIMFMFGIMIVYAGIKAFVLQKIDIVIISMLLGIPCVFSSFYRLFYARKIDSMLQIMV